ncbi:MAG: amidase [Herpetosiphon sp.]
MLSTPAAVGPIATRLRTGELPLNTYIDTVCDHIDASEPRLAALVPEPHRRARLHKAASELQARFPEPATRPLLYGVLVGVKDIINVAGLPTRAGSALPPEEFDGPEAPLATQLQQAGALILGKTVTTEFAFFEPGPTRNPRNLEHSPGGSSSGSAAAVAAGYCPLAIGTQTIGSVIRPAAFCGIVGFKPSAGRISTTGIVPFSLTMDQIGLFTQDVAGMAIAAAVLCADWSPSDPPAGRHAVLGVPRGAFLAQASPEALQAFEGQVTRLEQAGFTIRSVPVMDDFETIAKLHRQLVLREFAVVHERWFATYGSTYRPRTVDAIEQGRRVAPSQIEEALAARETLREELTALMAEHGIDLWISPAAVTTAPVGLASTGDPALNLPWTNIGFPTMTVPAGTDEHGLPWGLQCAAAMDQDEHLVAWAAELAAALDGPPVAMEGHTDRPR